MSSNLDGPFLKKIWERLRNSQVPIVRLEDYRDRNKIAKSLSQAIDDHVYLPSTIHGYLGIQKGGGVTRFLPILTANDMGVYYYLCYRLAPKILKRKKGIFGAWHMKPTVVAVEEDEAAVFGQGYGIDPFSSYWWLREWNEYNDLIRALIDDKEIGIYVVATDIANFYDSIEIPRLIAKIRKVAHSDSDTVEALNAFLSSWNRRHVGYMPSTKGIPQEIISDASRVLSHFYLQDFDDVFGEYCASKGLTYIRWADDFLIFGPSRRKLESAVHQVSRLLRDLGLNLSASKTRYMSKGGLRRYRALDINHAIKANDAKKVSSELRKIKKLIAEKVEFRQDTVFRSMIGFLHRNPAARTSTNISFISDMGYENRDLLHSLNNVQMLRFIQRMDDPMSAFQRLKVEIGRADFGGPKATFLHMMRKDRSELARLGMTKKIATSAINYIDVCSKDSPVVQEHCIPLVRSEYMK